MPYRQNKNHVYHSSTELKKAELSMPPPLIIQSLGSANTQATRTLPDYRQVGVISAAPQVLESAGGAKQVLDTSGP